MISNFENVKCSECNGDGVVESGGIPTPNLPETGYESNKGDLKKDVVEGGWKAAWADDITETDAAEGLVAAGVSIYSGNPATFYAWVDALVKRTITSLQDSAASVAPEIQSQIEDSASQAIKTALQGKSAHEVVKSFGQVDMKAGAIRYSGRNYIGDQTISRTWGLKPYVAIRVRAPGDNQPPQPSTNIGPTVDPQADPDEFDTLFDNSQKDYKITLKTGNRIGGGTDADVFITVVGVRGVQCAVPLEKTGNDRERGDTDHYHFRWRNLGPITSVNIWHDNSGIGPGWFLDEVRVENVTDEATWYFELEKWLALDEDDYRIGRHLTPTGAVD